MKKYFKIIACILASLMITGAFIGCKNGGEVEEPDPLVNYYKNTASEFAFDKWHSGVSDDVFEVDDEEVPGETFVVYRKFGLNTYSQVQSKVSGKLSDFSYINFEIKANKNIMMSAQLPYYNGYEETNGDASKESLIGELVFDVGTAKKTYSFRIFDSKRLMLDFIEDIYLFPEPGMSGTEYSGNFTIYNSYFSKERPAGSEFVNESGNGDSGTVEQKVGNWRNESTWTGYKVAPNSNGEVDVNFTRAASWATLSRIMPDFDLSHNTFELSFLNNEFIGDEYSISQISFRLRGDRKTLILDPAGYSYWSYYEADFGMYTLDKAAQDEKTSDNHRVDLSYDIINARNSIKNHITEGIRVVMLIESHPDYRYTGDNANYDGMGSMTIISASTKRDNTKEDVVNLSDFVGDGCYRLSSEDGKALDVTYDATTKHANIWHEFDALLSVKEYSFTIENKSDESVEFRYCFAIGESDYEFTTVTLTAGEKQTLTLTLTAGANNVKMFFDSNEDIFGSFPNRHLVITDFGITA